MICESILLKVIKYFGKKTIVCILILYLINALESTFNGIFSIFVFKFPLFYVILLLDIILLCINRVVYLLVEHFYVIAMK